MEKREIIIIMNCAPCAFGPEILISEEEEMVGTGWGGVGPMLMYWYRWN